MGGNIHVLVIEPIPILLTCIKLGMIKLNCAVDTASNNLMGLEKAKATYYDLIIIEIGEEHKMDGFEVAKQIKNQSLINQNTPLVAVTVHSVPGYKEKAKAAGMNGYFEGPFLVEMAKKIYSYAEGETHE